MRVVWWVSGVCGLDLGWGPVAPARLVRLLFAASRDGYGRLPKNCV